MRIPGGTRWGHIAIRRSLARSWAPMERARKILKQPKDDYDEKPEVDAGDGFVNYHNISMRKISSL